jgi:hypothetical protein
VKFEFEIPDQAIKEDQDLLTWVDCIKRMAERMSMSHFKYGNMGDHYPHSAIPLTNGKKRIELYEKSGNTEDMLDAANFCIIEAIFPAHSKRHFRARGSGETGLIYGGTEDV